MKELYRLYLVLFVMGLIVLIGCFSIYSWSIISQCGMDDFIARFHSGYKYGYSLCAPQPK